MFDSFWIKKTINEEINKSFLKEDLYSLNNFKDDGIDILKNIKIKENLLIYCFKKKLFKNIIFLISLYESENKDIENCFIYLKKEKLEKEFIFLTNQCQSKNKKLKKNLYNIRKYYHNKNLIDKSIHKS